LSLKKQKKKKKKERKKEKKILQKVTNLFLFLFWLPLRCFGVQVMGPAKRSKRFDHICPYIPAHLRSLKKKKKN
jgi:phosphoribosyl-dephospho-CoA transferase